MASLARLFVFKRRSVGQLSISRRRRLDVFTSRDRETDSYLLIVSIP